MKYDAACLVLTVMTYIKCEQGVQMVFVKNCVGKKLLIVDLSILSSKQFQGSVCSEGFR